jgi:BirA family transcriptional regulator, biotin operon repressor / biotin---[acetyl-CoA-carboxylase] ligase
VGTTLSPERVVPLLRGRFGRPYVHVPRCRSTQELVRGLPEGAVATTDEQTAGRGRLGRTWVSPPGTGLLVSLSLWPVTDPGRLAPLSLVLADAVCAVAGGGAMVRWPNDVVIGGRKLAGVLPEHRGGQVVAGIGVNVNTRQQDMPADARITPTSLLLERGAEVDRAELLADLLVEVERRYDAFERDGFPGLEHDELRGRRVRLADGTAGVSSGAAADGRLMVDGVAYTSAEVERVLVEDAPAGG